MEFLCSQRMDGRADLSDFELSNRYNVDNTGLVCKFSFAFIVVIPRAMIRTLSIESMF